MPRVRIIPATIATAALFFVVKVVDVVRGTEALSSGVLISKVEAETAGSETPEKKELPPTEKKEEGSKTAPEPTPKEEKPLPNAMNMLDQMTKGKDADKKIEAAAKDAGKEVAKEGEKKEGDAKKDDAKKEGEAKKDEEKKDEKKDAKEGEKKEEKKEAAPAKKKEGDGMSKEDRERAQEVSDKRTENAENAKSGKCSPTSPTRPQDLVDRHFTPIEVELLQNLSRRRDDLDRWEKNIEIKEQTLDATQKRIDAKIDQIEAMKKEVGELLAQYNEKEDAKIHSLVKIYENMKPKDAARIFNEIEMPILLEVIDKMSEKKVAPVLAEMDSKKAKQVTVELAEQRKVNSAKLKALNPALAPGTGTVAPTQGTP